MLALSSLGGLALVPTQPVAALQNPLVRDSLTVLGPAVGKIPFGPGEELRFTIDAGIWGGGSAHMRIGALDTIHGFPTLPVDFGIEGRAMGGAIKLNEKFYSWLDAEGAFSRRFLKITDHGRSTKEYEFFPMDGLVRRIDHDTTWALPSPLPLDDLSFVYFARTIPLEVGESYTYNRYFKESGNPVILKVLRRDRVKVEAGEFDTIVVQPIIPESNLFKEGARAEIHFSDDDRRLVVFMKVTQYWIATLTMELSEFKEGVQADPSDRRR